MIKMSRMNWWMCGMIFLNTAGLNWVFSEIKGGKCSIVILAISTLCSFLCFYKAAFSPDDTKEKEG